MESSGDAPKKKATRKRTTTVAKKTTAKKTTKKKAAAKKVAATSPAKTPAPEHTTPVEKSPAPAPPASAAPSSPPAPAAAPARQTDSRPENSADSRPAPGKVVRESIPRGDRQREPKEHHQNDQNPDTAEPSRDETDNGRREGRNDRNNHRDNRNNRDDRGGNRNRRRRGGRNRRGRNPREGGERQNDAPQSVQGSQDNYDYDDEDLDDDPNVKPGFRDRKRNRTRINTDNPVACEGLFELSSKGFGFLRSRDNNFQQTKSDVFILPDTVRHFGLREGMLIVGEACDGQRGPQMTDIKSVNGREPGSQKGLSYFEELTAINPDKRYGLETVPDRFTTRVIDMMTPIGRGQRGLIVAPPRAGKTTLLQHIAEGISANYEDVHLMTLLIDERPEEVTALTRSLPNAEVFASSNDNDAKNHMRIAEIAIERAKRLVEEGRDVFILLDSITRLGRAYNHSVKGKGRSMSGGIDVRALEIPRKLFAAARNTREAGSLTIIGTALIETGSRADDLIFQEFKGTGNMELVLDRAIAQKYVYPAIDIFRSGTRREELLLPPHQLAKISLIRRGLSGHKPIEAIERLLSFLERFPTNAQMLMEIKAQGY